MAVRPEERPTQPNVAAHGAALPSENPQPPGDAGVGKKAKRVDLLLLGIVGGASFGGTLMHGGAAAAQALYFADATHVAHAYGSGALGLLAYHILLGALGGAMVGLVARQRIAKEIEATGLQVQVARAQRMEAVARLAAGVNHDVNNLLSALQMQLHMAKKAKDPADRERHLARAQEITTKAGLLPRRLLLYTRQTPGEPADASVVVAGAIELLRPAMGPDIKIEESLDDGGRVRLDASSLEQVLINLMVNARDAQEGRGKVRVALRAEPARVVLEVLDDGPGFTPEVMANLFRPLFTTKPAERGTGLGLSTCKSLVEGVGGTMRAFNRPEGGAAFEVVLPRA